MTAAAEQGQVAEQPAEETAPTQGQPAEQPETKAEETEDKSSTETEGEGTGVEPEETVEEKTTRLERENAGKQKKIDRQTAANRASNEKQEKLRQENEKLQALIVQQKPETEPKVDDFETHEEYNDAVKDYISKQAKAEAQQEFLAQQQHVQQEQLTNERMTLRRSQEAEYIVENPMYNAAANEVGAYIKSLDVSHGTEEAVISQLYDGNVPSVIDYFGSNNGENLEELGQISRLSPPQAAVAIYKIQQKLSANPVKTKTTPKVTPVKVQRGDSKAFKPLSKKSGTDILDWAKQK